MQISANLICPCGSGLKYKKCCRLYHQGVPGPTLEALMRSRYTAYALHNIEYIMRTTHPDSPHYGSKHEAWQQEIEAFCRSVRFAKLDILEIDGNTVMFHASLFEGSRDVSFTERSLFKQVDGHWLYHSALSLNSY